MLFRMLLGICLWCPQGSSLQRPVKPAKASKPQNTPPRWAKAHARVAYAVRRSVRTVRMVNGRAATTVGGMPTCGKSHRRPPRIKPSSIHLLGTVRVTANLATIRPIERVVGGGLSVNIAGQRPHCIRAAGPRQPVESVGAERLIVRPCRQSRLIWTPFPARPNSSGPVAWQSPAPAAVVPQTYPATHRRPP